MILEPIQASEFAKARPPRRSPAACKLPPLLRLSVLVAVGIGLVSVTLDPGRVMTAGAEAVHGANSV